MPITIMQAAEENFKYKNIRALQVRQNGTTETDAQTVTHHAAQQKRHGNRTAPQRAARGSSNSPPPHAEGIPLTQSPVLYLPHVSTISAGTRTFSLSRHDTPAGRRRALTGTSD